MIKLNLCTSIRAETLSDLPDLLSMAFDEGSTYVEIRLDYLIKSLEGDYYEFQEIGKEPENLTIEQIVKIIINNKKTN